MGPIPIDLDVTVRVGSAATAPLVPQDVPINIYLSRNDQLDDNDYLWHAGLLSSGMLDLYKNITLVYIISE